METNASDIASRAKWSVRRTFDCGPALFLVWVGWEREGGGEGGRKTALRGPASRKAPPHKRKMGSMEGIEGSEEDANPALRKAEAANIQTKTDAKDDEPQCYAANEKDLSRNRKPRRA